MSTETIEWIDRFGRSLTLVHGTPLIGMHGPPRVRRSERRIPGQAGAASETRPVHEPRDMVIPIVIQAASRAARNDLTREYSDLMGDGETGRIRFTHGDGSQREIDCYLDGGLDDLVDVMPRHVLPVLELRALWPYWRDVAAADIMIELNFDDAPAAGTSTPSNDPNTGSNDPIPSNGYTGEGLVSGVVTTELVHDGTAPNAYPVWTLPGPFNVVELTNLTTAKTLLFTAPVAAGETLVIDTRPEARTIEVDGINRFIDTAEGVALWPLVKDVNQVKIRLIATGATTAISASWKIEHQEL